MLNGPARNHYKAIPVLPCGIFLRRMEMISFSFLFLAFKRTLWEVVPNHEIWVPRGLTMEKYSLHLIFTFYIKYLTESYWCWKYSLLLYFIQNNFSINLYWPTDWQFKLSLKLLDRGRKIQNNVRINIYYCKPDLISWRSINIAIFIKRFLPPTDQKCADCRRIDSSSIIAHPVNS